LTIPYQRTYTLSLLIFLPSIILTLTIEKVTSQNFDEFLSLIGKPAENEKFTPQKKILCGHALTNKADKE